jgi:hypothetical protein
MALRTEKDKKAGDCEMRVIDRTGDSKHYWDSESLDEVKAARQMFVDLTAKNYKAYRMTAMGNKGKVMRFIVYIVRIVQGTPPMRSGLGKREMTSSVACLYFVSGAVHCGLQTWRTRVWRN